MNIVVNRVNLFYDVKGAGRPLLLLHGNGEDHTVFAPLAEKLSRNFTVYSIDSRNHGQSDRSDDYSYATMAADITAFVRRLALESPLVVGFSDGAIIALTAQIASPGLFSRMALLGPNLSPDDMLPEVYGQIDEAFHRKGDPLLKLMLTEPHIDPSELEGVDVPVLVVGAENDIYRPETFETIAVSLPDSRLMIVEGHDHGSYILDTDIMYKPLVGFFY